MGGRIDCMARVKFLDLLKGVAIFCVVFGHTIQYVGRTDFFHDGLFEFIYSYHMPLFMVVSGLFSLKSMGESITQLIIKKSRALILPCLSWSCICMLVVWVINLVKSDNQPLMLLFIHHILYDFWFLKCVFLCYIMVYASIKLFVNLNVAACISILFAVLLPDIYHIAFMLPFFWIGIYMNKYSDLIDKYSFVVLIFSGAIFIIMSLFWTGDYTIYRSPITIIHYRSTPHIIPEELGAIIGVGIYRFLIGAFGSLMFFLISKLILQKCVNSSLANYVCGWGACSLGIYILQTFILEQGFAYLFSRSKFLLDNTFLELLLAVVITAMCYSIVLLINRSNLLSFFLLGRQIKK